MTTDEQKLTDVPREHKVARKTSLLSIAGPAGVLAATLVYVAQHEPYADDGGRAAAAAIATFFSTFGVVAGVAGRSALHVVVGLNAGMVAGAAWWLATLGLPHPAGLGEYVGLLAAWAVFGALFGLADWTRGHAGLGACAGGLAAFSFPFAWMVAFYDIATLPVRFLGCGGIPATVVFGTVLLGLWLALADTGLFLVVGAVASSYYSARLFFLLLRDRGRIGPLPAPTGEEAAPESDTPAEAEARAEPTGDPTDSD